MIDCVIRKILYDYSVYFHSIYMMYFMILLKYYLFNIKTIKNDFLLKKYPLLSLHKLSVV